MSWVTRGFLIAVLAVMAPSAFAGKNITVKGSDTMVVLGQKWAEVYMQKNAGATIQVTGGGSGVGIAALINGTTDLANSSRPIKESEIEKAQKAGYYPEEIKVAMDSLAVVTNTANPIKELSMKQLLGIYTGKINNWNEVGGPDQAILRYCRESSSGTYVFFKEHVLKNKDYAADCQTMPGTSAVASAVSKDPAGIGYGGAAYYLKQPQIKILPVKKDDKSEAVSPVKADGTLDYEAAWTGRYPVARYLYMYAGFRPKGDIRAYIDWILSPEGQKIVEEVGYVPLEVKA
ncbi:MAG TPA: PstS family phosphate ABC transporter substrate-binding protein [Candidatus Omnitrophota bacterium]|nr:PstS family phosphate ABC transporter substrate-binding protein [Candidatus Omnitrophota bacterium]HRY85338.1 PstS family phosphate ABC transporter substrate-binding protein [Candidatus Omnitrophota bacterium]